jgi:hypothetical protein
MRRRIRVAALLLVIAAACDDDGDDDCGTDGTVRPGPAAPELN